MANENVQYSHVAIPQDLINEVKRLIKDKKELGYRNKSEFIIECIRRCLLEIKKD